MKRPRDIKEKENADGTIDDSQDSDVYKVRTLFFMKIPSFI